MSEIEVLPVNPKQSPQTVIFSKYEVGKLLGCGAFAKVYHARDIKNGKSVAIKVINKKKLKSTASMSNIIREISIMRRLHHPHIVQLFEVLATKTKIFVVMEHVKGGELFAKVSKGRLSENLSRKYFQQLISAVSYCHSHGIYHRDLKPENLLLDDNGDLKVTDFGLSAVNDQVSEDGLLHTLCGTPAYVAPEILARKGYEGAKVDVWSCGIILYVLICGYLPFNDPNLMVMYKKIYKGEFRCPKWISADLKRFLTRFLNTDPSTRITIEEIKRDPWFKKGYKETKITDFEEDFGGFKDEKEGMDFMNAFDLISFSSGLDLSGLIEQSADPVRDSQQLVVESSPESIMERVETVAKELENFRLNKKKDRSVELQGQNGKMAIKLLVHRLTDRLSVVDVKRRAGDGRLFQELLNGKLLPAIHSRSESQDSRP